jgi:DNA mismatch repair protein MutS2
MKLFPASAIHQLEFDKIKNLLAGHCRTEYAGARAENLRIHTRLEFIKPELNQTREYKLFFTNQLHFPDEVLNLSGELRLLGIGGSTLSGHQFLQIRKMAVAIQQLFRWFTDDRREAFPYLALVIKDTYYEKAIIGLIDGILDEEGHVKDNASEALAGIRLQLYKKRNELRRLFDRIVNKLNKLGYLADMEESFLNGRRVLAVFAEQKRLVKGILHGESDTRRTAYIEPEEIIPLNNEIFGLENQEHKEIQRILKELTSHLSLYHPLLQQYHKILGEFDFIRAKAILAIEYGGDMPAVTDKADIHLIKAIHPLLYVYNTRLNKPTIAVDLELNEQKRILVISGPNAGGKTVTMKTAGLLQMMVQSGLLVSCSPHSEFGIFRQLMIHMGDTQNLEFELSTYSAHLINMKYFTAHANGRTLFFIDELGSGSDPNLGGAFAEVILDELAGKHARGIVTTHYLNLKVMANKVAGIFNGAMAFDEKKLQPLYKLITGKPGSSYTFSIAERIGLPRPLIEKAKKLVDENHFSLDKLLNRTEQDLEEVTKEKAKLDQLIKDNDKLKKELETTLNKERHRQQVEILKQQNQLSEEKIRYLKDMDRKLKALVVEWRKSDDKKEVIKMMQSLLFKQREKQVTEKQQKKFDSRYIESTEPVKEGDKVKMKANRQIGIVTRLKGKKAIIQVGTIPITVNVADLVVVKDKVPAIPEK